MSLEKHFGLIVLDKPRGVTSRQAINTVQKLARPSKVGHAGTLDPLASGVLVTCVGPATRLIDFVQKMTKTYHATFLLGRRSDTEDVDGAVEMLDNPPEPSLERLREAAEGLTGRILQRPPAFSALKVDGRRAYDLARAGQTFELIERPVDIYRIDMLRYDYPELELRIQCGSGTYVRSLGRDLAERVGTAAVMSALVREAIGDFTLENAVAPDRLTPDSWAEYLLPAARAVEQLPRIVVDDETIKRLRNGLPIRASRDALNAGRSPSSGDESPQWAAVDESGRLIALLVPRGRDQLGPRCNFIV